MNYVFVVKKAGKIISIIFFSFLVTIALLMIASRLPISGNYSIFVVRSGSMEPTIKEGSVVVVKPEEDYRIGDIITFHAGFRGPNGERVPVTHRIHDIRIERGNPVFITKGDANEEVDQREILRRDVIGKTIFWVPYVGYAVEAARRPFGFLALVLIPAGIIFFDRGKFIFAEIKKRRRAQEVL